MSEPNSIPAFIASAVAEPDDDLRRLVFCDWLEENNDSGQDTPCRCRDSKHGAGKVEHVSPAGVLFVADCDICNGSGRIFRPPNLYGSIAGFIRTQIELAKITGSGKCSACGMDYESDLSKGTGGIRLPGSPVRSDLARHTAKKCDRCAGLLAQERGYGEEVSQVWLMTHADQLGMRKVKLGVDTIIRPEPPQSRPGQTMTPLDWSERRGNVWVSFRRGFPDRLSMALFSFHLSEGNAMALGEYMVAKYPLTEFVANDRQPQYLQRRRGARPTYTFWREDTGNEMANPSALIPAELFNRFKGGEPGRGDVRARNYDSHRLAMLDLSQAVLSMARERAARFRPESS